MTVWPDDGTSTVRSAALLESKLRSYTDSSIAAIPAGSSRSDEVWIQDFGGVADGSSTGAGSGTDNTPALTAAIAALDVNRGGTVRFNQGKYYFASGISTSHAGLNIQGEGSPGIALAPAVGSTQFIVANGVTWLTYNPGGSPSHITRGPTFRNFHLFPAASATTGNGILIQNAESGIVQDVRCTDFIGGYGLKLDGLAGNSQYWELRNYGGSRCLTGLHLKNAPNAARILGGYYEGNQTPLVGSKAIYVESGDTTRIYGVVIQGWETGIYIASPAADHELFGPRFEYCNTSLRIASRRTHLYGGSFDNNLLLPAGATAASICIQLDSGATNCYLNPADMQAFGTALVDNSADVTNEYHLNFDTQPRNRYAGMAAAPASGAHVVGEIVWNSAPASAGFIGWVCTAAGTPGTWKTFGVIS